MLFADVRKNYFPLYFHYVYFKSFRSGFGQADAIFSVSFLSPNDRCWHITYGLFQIADGVCLSKLFVPIPRHVLADHRSTDFAIYKRLRAFEATLEEAPLPEIDRAFPGTTTEAARRSARDCQIGGEEERASARAD